MSRAIYCWPKLEPITWVCSRDPVKSFPKLNHSLPRRKKETLKLYHSPRVPGGRPTEKQMISAHTQENMSHAIFQVFWSLVLHALSCMERSIFAAKMRDIFHNSQGKSGKTMECKATRVYTGPFASLSSNEKCYCCCCLCRSIKADPEFCNCSKRAKVLSDVMTEVSENKNNTISQFAILLISFRSFVLWVVSQ